VKPILDQIKKYFGFSTGESQGFLVLLFLLLIYAFGPSVWRWLASDNEPVVVNNSQYIDSLQAVIDAHTIAQDSNQTWRQNSYSDYDRPDHFEKNKQGFVAKTLFYFDPNTVSAEQLVTTGLPQSICERLVKYRNAGGKFYKTEDFRKLYGIHDNMYEVLAPYIRIEHAEKQPHNIAKNDINEAQPKYSRPVIKPFDINTADTATLSQIRGIGPVLAQRIVNWRQKLGGFHSAAQIEATYGLSPEVSAELLQYAIINKANIKKIKINEVEKLYHPKLPYHVAKAILAYRSQHGAFANADELRKVKLLDETLLNELLPYLSFD
jgi:competence protein ComEA